MIAFKMHENMTTFNWKLLENSNPPDCFSGNVLG